MGERKSKSRDYSKFVSARVYAEDKERLEDIADEYRVNVSVVVRWAVESYLVALDRKDNPAAQDRA